MIKLSQLRSVVKARLRVGIAVSVIVLGLTAVVTVLSTPQYTSTAAVVADLKSPDPITGILQPAILSSSYLATQTDLIRSERVALKVVRKQGLGASQDLKEQWRSATDGRGDFERWIAAQLLRRLEVAASRESSVITISYSGPSPEFSAHIVNAFMAAYFEVTGELRAELAKSSKELFDAQAMEAKSKLEDAQKKLTDFQSAKGLISSDERLDVELSKLAELNSQLIAVQAQRVDTGARAGNGIADASAMQEVLGSPLIIQLKTDLVRLESKQKELEARFGERHPDVQVVRESIAQVRSRIDQETSRLLKGVGMANSVNKTREADIRAQIEQQRRRVQDLKALRDEASVASKEVENLQRNYDAVLNKVALSSLEAKSSQTNLSPIQYGSPSATPSYPKPILNVAVGAFAAVLGALMVMIAVEIIDRRVRVEDDITELDLPILVSIPKVDYAALVGPTRMDTGGAVARLDLVESRQLLNS